MLELDYMPDWHKEAACFGVGNEIFFPERGESTRLAEEYCKSCPVKEKCFMACIMYERDLAGIWGGLSARARTKEVKRRLQTGELDEDLVGSKCSGRVQ